MKISICIPQYNRSRYLLAVLDSILVQDYKEIEVTISDDASKDDSEILIPSYIAKNAHRLSGGIKYVRQQKNLGYDGNLRAAMSLATGDYIFILGNDDGLAFPDSISKLAAILEKFGRPEAAFSNFIEFGVPEAVISRAKTTSILGAGPQIALKFFRFFSFVGGVIVKREFFGKYNTHLYDGSVYFQIYLSARIVAAGGRLLAISEPLVAKDVKIGGDVSNSYRDVLARDNAVFVPRTGGLSQVARVAYEAISPYVGQGSTAICLLRIYSQIYTYCYTLWLMEYRRAGVYRASLNLALGCFPSRFILIPGVSSFIKGLLYVNYGFATLIGLFMPLSFLVRIANLVRRIQQHLNYRGVLNF